MLDEIREYQEYTCNPLAKEGIRLNPKILFDKGHFNGLGRALTTIAREELDKRGYFGLQDEDFTIVDAVICALKEWLGFIQEGEETISQYNSWMKKYYNAHKEDASVEWDKFVKSRKSQYGKGLFTEKTLPEKTLPEKDTKLEVTYDKVVADAIYQGPLKRYYLICKKGFEQDLYKKSKNDFVKQLNPKLATDSRLIDNVLRLICVYLIKKEYTGNTSNNVNLTDVAHWAQNKSINHGGYYDGLKYKKRKNLILSKTIGKNYTKKSLCKDFMETYDFKIIEASEFSGIEEGYTFFSDQGAGIPLAENKLY